MGDGKVTLEEMRSVMELGPCPLTSPEWSRYEAFFRRADADGKGYLTVSEYIRAYLHDASSKTSANGSPAGQVAAPEAMKRNPRNVAAPEASCDIAGLMREHGLRCPIQRAEFLIAKFDSSGRG